MGAATKDRNTPYKQTEMIVLLLAAGATIHAGTMVVVNAAGYAEAGHAAEGLVYMGRAEQAIDNSAGIDGAKSIYVRHGLSFKFDNNKIDPITQAHVGRPVYMVDDQTVSASSNGRSACGVVQSVETDGVWIK